MFCTSLQTKLGVPGQDRGQRTEEHGQDTTRPGTRQDRTGQSRGHDRTRQDRTGDRTGQDKTGQDRTRQDRTGQGTGQGTGRDKTWDMRQDIQVIGLPRYVGLS